MDDIGYQDGIDAFEQWFRKLSKFADEYNAWRNTDRKAAPPVFPKIPLEGPNFSEANMTTWPWPRKFFRNTMRKLKDGFDAANPNDGGGNGGEEPPPPIKRYAPRTYNLASNNSDPRFCCKPEYGVVDKGSYYEDEMGCWYDKEHMFSIGGPGGYRERSYMVQGLNEANNMNGKEPCDPYVSDAGLSVPPYPGDPAAQTGSYHR